MNSQLGGGDNLLKVIRDTSQESLELMKRKLTATCTPTERLLGHNTRCFPSDPNSIEKSTGKSAIMIACETRQFEKVKLLLEQPTIRLNINDKQGKSIFNYAEGSSEIYNLLSHYIIEKHPIKQINNDFFSNQNQISASKLFFKKLIDHFIELKTTVDIEDPNFKYSVNTEIGDDINLFELTFKYDIYKEYRQNLIDNGATIKNNIFGNLDFYALRYRKLEDNNIKTIIKNMIIENNIKGVYFFMIFVFPTNKELVEDTFNKLVPVIKNKPELVNLKILHHDRMAVDLS
jgi:hypothetical protein